MSKDSKQVSIRLKSFLEIFAVAFWLNLLLGLVSSPVIVLVASIYYPPLLYVVLIYLCWMVYDSKSPDHGGWKSSDFRKWFARLSIWDEFRDYFPAHLICAETLDPNYTYIMGYHPHGLYCLGAWANIFLSRHFQDMHPGIDVRAATLPVNFIIPFWRDFILALGTISCDKSAVVKILNPESDNNGMCLVIAVGGGEEFTYMSHGTMDLVVKKRKGFVKLAITSGASLLPTIGFGENELYARLQHPYLEPLHKLAYTLARMAAPIFVGRFMTPLPFRAPLVTVVGRPIHVKRNQNPSPQELDDVHQKYMNELQKLYDEYKNVYHKDRKRDLQFIA